MFAREGYPFIVGSAILAAVVFGAALRFRSWPLWLAAVLLTVVALWSAGSFVILSAQASAGRTW